MVIKSGFDNNEAIIIIFLPCADVVSCHLFTDFDEICVDVLYFLLDGGGEKYCFLFFNSSVCIF